MLEMASTALHGHRPYLPGLTSVYSPTPHSAPATLAAQLVVKQLLPPRTFYSTAQDVLTQEP